MVVVARVVYYTIRTNLYQDKKQLLLEMVARVVLVMDTVTITVKMVKIRRLRVLIML